MIRLEVHISTQTETYTGRIAVRQRVVVIWGRLGAVNLFYPPPTEHVVEDNSVGLTRLCPGDVHSPGCGILLGVNTVQWDVVRSSYTGGKKAGFKSNNFRGANGRTSLAKSLPKFNTSWELNHAPLQ